jgi:hypothetical protein
MTVKKSSNSESDAQHSETLAKVEHPAEHFDHPAEVVVDPALSKDDKRRALEGMEQDAMQLATATAEGMPGGKGSGLSEVLEAKQALELPPFDLAVSVVLQALRTKLPAAKGTETHALISRAIEALDTASVAIRSGG